MRFPVCSCTVLTPKPKALCDDNCIYAPNMLVSDQVTACDGVTNIDISPIIAKCGDNQPYFSILSYKNVTGQPTITSNQITFTPANNNYAPGEIVYKVSCGILSASGKIIIAYKDNCSGVICTNGKICNKCTGNCENIEIDLSVIKEQVINEENTSGFVI